MLRPLVGAIPRMVQSAAPPSPPPVVDEVALTEVAGGPIRFQAPFQAAARKRRGLPYSIDAFRPGKSDFPSPFAGVFTLLARPETPSRLPRMRCASSIASIIGVKSGISDSATSPSIRRQTGVPAGASGLLRCVHRQLRRQQDLFENIK